MFMVSKNFNIIVLHINFKLNNVCTAPDPPANITIKQIEHNQLLLSWIPPTQSITGYHIYVEPHHELDMEYYFADRNFSHFTVHSLRERETYNVSMLALSPFLPSLLTDPIEITLRRGMLSSSIRFYEINNLLNFCSDCIKFLTILELRHLQGLQR